MRQRRGFTLLELLIVVAIIAILATLVLGGLAAARRKAQVATARQNISAIQAALQMYESDTGRYPRRPGTPSATNIYVNDMTYVYAALRNRRTAAVGGGPNSPYLDWKPEQLGLATTAAEGADFQKDNPDNITPAIPQLNGLPQSEIDQLNDPTYQAAHKPGSNQAVTFLDPWGNPYVYREWASVPASIKDAAQAGRTVNVTLVGGGTSTSGGEARTDRIHDPSKFDIYSFGPNGINEFGDPKSDDVASWTNQSGRN